MRARDAKQKEDPAYNARMASLYREVVLKEKPVVAENGFIPLGALSNPQMAVSLQLRRSRKRSRCWETRSSFWFPVSGFKGRHSGGLFL